MSQSRLDQGNNNELLEQLKLLDTLATAIRSPSDSDADMNAKLTELADEITAFTQAIRADEKARLNPQSLAIAKAISAAIMVPSEDNQKILRKTAKDTYYEVISYKIEALIAQTKKALQSQLLGFFVGFMMSVTAITIMGPVGGIISMAAALYIDTQVAKHTPEELAKKATDAKKTSAAFYKAHGLLTKAGNTKIDDKTQREISDKIDKSAPRK